MNTTTTSTDTDKALALWNEIVAIEDKIASRTSTPADIARFNAACDAFDSYPEAICRAAMDLAVRS